MKNLSKPLKDSDIELRISNVSAGKGFSLLAYKTARIDRQRLDEVVGCMNWQNKHRIDEHGNVLCSIGIWDKEKDQWIWKEDAGFTDKENIKTDKDKMIKEKGNYSDSFKRAGFRWGIGIELYQFPFIWINWNKWDGKKPLDVYGLKLKYIGKTYQDGIEVYIKENLMWSNREAPVKTQTKNLSVFQLQQQLHDKLAESMKEYNLDGEDIVNFLYNQANVKKTSEIKDKKILQDVIKICDDVPRFLAVMGGKK